MNTKLIKVKKYKILLLEGIHQNAVDFFEKQGMEVELLKGALDQETLCEKIKPFHAVGVRSKTKITKEVLDAAQNLLCVGCFCIGTDQTDLDYAMNIGVPVFNSPFMNTRSVAELVISEMIFLSRKLPEKNRKLHAGGWNKTSLDSYEIRGKKLGIIGYGHVGSQLSVLAEAMGMIVSFYDIKNVLPIGNATPVSLDKLLSENQFISLHVPKTKLTKHMIGKEEISKMPKGSYLINAARGDVIVVQDVKDALESGHLAGAAVDVFEVEPKSNGENCFTTVLQGEKNTILTPHIGGSTQEAQENISVDVAIKLSNFLQNGITAGSVNFPNLNSQRNPDTHRITQVHHNVPGVLKEMNNYLETYNVVSQSSSTKGPIGYAIIDVDHNGLDEILEKIANSKTTIRVRKAW